MPRTMNKHGFTGVRKRTDGRAKPYYARVTINGGYVYTQSHDTPDDAARDFERYAAARDLFAVVETPRPTREAPHE